MLRLEEIPALIITIKNYGEKMSELFIQNQDQLSKEAWDTLRRNARIDSRNAKRKPRITNPKYFGTRLKRGERIDSVNISYESSFLSFIKKLWRKLWKFR